ncbi:type VII secretion integral membrane protein EccD [Parafrankia irregularis]|uniref:Type VII secretion integral membrane protein EccD n=2 Tax=Parafrankia TaxID=2994362 RepID=A0A0S4QMD2_9ACTN|nr:type VII secretion integral membrane protein EccD [Parafrankia irregularis]MBE3202271.1 type VII secretion integral membrane protein EccD [Parafrankia sp. CH37]CUU56040.1 type VII secretion integral membrane protein EccD [Parafrankia irregularis]
MRVTLVNLMGGGHRAEVMGQSSVAEVCRLLVVGPTSQVEVSVPCHVPLADLMPALLRGLGPDLADRGLEHSGWVAQRLGEPPLDEDDSVADHGLLDGDTVHLRPRSDQIPPLDFDDLIDGVSTGIKARSGLWRPRTTRLASLLALAGWLLVALATLPASRYHYRALIAAEAVVLLGAVTVATSRLIVDRAVAALAGAAMVGFITEAAVFGVADAGVGGDPTSTARLMLMAGSAATVVGVGLLLLLTAGHPSARPLALAGTAVACGGFIGCGLGTLAGLDRTQTAAVIALLCVGARPLVPVAAFTCAGLALPPLPVEPGELQDDIDPEPSAEVLARTAAADSYMTALHVACGALSATALVMMALDGRWIPTTLVVLVGLAQALTARPMTSTWHRLALVLPAAAGLVVIVLPLGMRDGGWEPGWLAPIVSLAFALAAAGCARVLPRRRMTPMWGRGGDFAHITALVLAVPLVAWLLGLIGLIRSVVG